MFLENREYAKAIESFTRAIERRPNALAYERRGKALFSMGRPIEAIGVYGKAQGDSIPYARRGSSAFNRCSSRSRAFSLTADHSDLIALAWTGRQR